MESDQLAEKQQALAGSKQTKHPLKEMLTGCAILNWSPIP
jgi:hypothetical protein